MNKWTLNRLGSQAEKLKEKIRFYEDYLPIKIQEIEEKKIRKLDYIKKAQQSELQQLAILAGLSNESIKEEKNLKIQALDDSYKLKFKALKQSHKRALNKQKDESEINQKFEVKENLLKQSKDNALQRIQDAYKPKGDLDAARKKYEMMKDHFDKEYQVRSNELDEKTERLTTATVNRLTQKRDKLQKRLYALTKRLNTAKSLIADLNYGVDKSVILKLENLTMRFGGLVAVNDLNFEVKKGEIFGLIGPNGAGKTTIFNCITRFYRPTAGNMYFRQNDFEVARLNEYKVHNIVKLGIARTFQNVELVWELSILDNLLVAAHTKYQTGFAGQILHTRNLAREEAVYKKKALDVLELMGLSDYRFAYPLGLPYGILKKIELARTLMTDPKLIILDEPAAGLNEQETQQLAKIIRKIRDEFKITIFLVEHDMGLVMDICDTVCAISFGKKLAIGTPKEIQNDPLVRQAYLGEEQ